MGSVRNGPDSLLGEDSGLLEGHEVSDREDRYPWTLLILQTIKKGVVTKPPHHLLGLGN